MADGNPTAAPTRFDIFWWATTFRGLSALTNVALITVSVFGFDVGVEMSVEDGSVFETYSFSELGSFLATISVYYVALGFMALCAEMRWKFAAGKLRKVRLRACGAVVGGLGLTPRRCYSTLVSCCTTWGARCSTGAWARRC